ncbi:hypothetical protein [Chamaesiphon sp. VAR_69_metabat_338]|uniref:hypothetical protein n=1 Tax=Chamaesiphon sp. VAR_69_metabat_338 TaxID=2964704 RepID=UPI00286DA8DC|nr:hypothetical protein [Chamaesiphon sp. VAR_69_metabat_338]
MSDVNVPSGGVKNLDYLVLGKFPSDFGRDGDRLAQKLTSPLPSIVTDSGLELNLITQFSFS